MAATLQQLPAGDPVTIRLVEWEIEESGYWVAAIHRVMGRDKPIAVLPDYGQITKFNLVVLVLSEEEWNDVMDILWSGSAFELESHHGQTFTPLRTIGPITYKQIKAMPTAGETYTTRFAYEISTTVQVVDA